VAVSPDGRHVYVAAEVDDAVSVFLRPPRFGGRGSLRFLSMVADGVGRVDGLDGASAVVVSPDGRHVYVAGANDNAVAVFERDAENGALTERALYRDGVRGVDGLEGASALALNPLGDRLLVAGGVENAVALFRRDAVSGGLVLLEVLRDGMPGVDGLAGVASLVVTHDGTTAFAAGHDDDALASLYVPLCLGDEATGDDDHDAVCDDVDLCRGDDYSGDHDGDGVCGDVDLCEGDDALGDADGDGVCDVVVDLCEGDDATGDADGDGICADLDCDDADPLNVCPIFGDGFESGTTGAWAVVFGGG
jgi:DNA-binding beta-propeller fold protein YncE